MHRLSYAFVAALLSSFAATGFAEVTLDFTQHMSGNIAQQVVVITVDVDSVGGVTADVDAGWDIGVSGTVSAGFDESFTITLDVLDGRNGPNSNVRIDGDGSGFGAQGDVPGRVSWADGQPAELVEMAVDLSGVTLGEFSFTEATFGEVTNDPTVSITDFDGVVNTFGPSATSATLGTAGFTLDSPSVGEVVFSNDVQGVGDDGDKEYSIETFSFELVPVVPDMEALVSRATGLVTITNNSGGDIDLVGLSLLSAAGSLDPSDWQSLDENPAVTESWETAAESDVELGEIAVDLGSLEFPVTTLGDGESLVMGEVHELGSVEDMQLEYLTESSDTPVIVDATYVDATDADLFAGDFNDDGVVDAADYTVWRDNLGAEVALANETVSLGAVTIDDYQTWVENFGAVEGGSIIATPEPSSLLLALAGVVAGLRRRR